MHEVSFAITIKLIVLTGNQMELHSNELPITREEAVRQSQFDFSLTIINFRFVTAYAMLRMEYSSETSNHTSLLCQVEFFFGIFFPSKITQWISIQWAINRYDSINCPI